ncbi:membrane protein [Mycobacteroides abscessus]|nr:membrane protein [Mycobacteroides abscessus]
MDVVLGVSMTPTTARLVLVEGAGADGRIVDTDTIVVSEGEGTTSEQVLSAIVGTRDGMLDGGHNLVSTGVVWSDHAEAAELRDSLASRGIDGVEFFSALHAGGALAKAASSVTGYDKSALLVIEPQTATLAVVDSADGSIVGLASEPLITGVTSGVLANLVNPLKGKENAPDGVFLLGLDTDVSDLAESLGDAIALPVNSPDQPELALARGAALASAQEPDFEASTALLGQAYSLEGPTGTGFAHPDAVTESAGEANTELREFEDFDDQPAERKPFLLVGAPLLLVFGICSIALAVSLTVTVRSTVDQGPSSPDRGVVQNPLPAEAPKQAAPPPAPVEAPAPAVSPAPVQQVVAPAPQHNPAPAPKQVAPAPVQVAPQVPAPAPEAPAPAAPAPVPEEQPAPVAPRLPCCRYRSRCSLRYGSRRAARRIRGGRTATVRGTRRPPKHSSRRSSPFPVCRRSGVVTPTAGPTAAHAVARVVVAGATTEIPVVAPIAARGVVGAITAAPTGAGVTAEVPVVAPTVAPGWLGR